jgi:hypothetical protein
VDDAIGGTRHRLVVGHQHDRRLTLLPQPPEESEHHVDGGAVEAARRLVGQQHGRIVGQRPRNGDSLTFATGQLGREAVAETPEAHLLEELVGVGSALAVGATRPRHGDLHVFADREPGQQVVELKHQPHLFAPEPAGVMQVHHVVPVDADRTLGGRVERGDQMQQGRLPAPRVPRDRSELAGGHREVYAVERVDQPVVVGLLQAVDLDRRHLAHVGLTHDSTP